MKIKIFLLFALLSFICMLFACSDTTNDSNPKSSYQKPNLKKGDSVLIRSSKTTFVPAIICATKNGSGAGDVSDIYACRRTTNEQISQLKEGEVLVAASWMGSEIEFKVGPVKDDEIILHDKSNSFPAVKPNDIVVIKNPSGGIDEYEAVKVVEVRGEKMDYIFLKDGRSSVYPTSGWYIPSPKVVESLKQP